MADRLQLGRSTFAIGQHIGDRVAVLALQAVDQMHAFFDLGQAVRVELDAVAVVRQLACQIIQ